MGVCLISNVGQRDLQQQGEPLNPRELRKTCRELLNQFDGLQAELGAPMIEASLRLILNSVDRVDTVVLLATDQKDETHLSGDTIVAAEVIKKLLEFRFKDKEGKAQIQQVRIIKVQDAPNDYDVMMDFYLKSVIPLKALRDAEKVYLLCTGGTPACNTALMLNGVNGFLDRAEVLYVREKEEYASATSVGAQILEHHKKNSLRSLLENYDFNAIASSEGYDEPVRELARAAAARMNFDFQNALFLLNKLKKNIALLPYKEPTELLVKQLMKLAGRSPDFNAVMEDLYWSAILKWQRDECADFLGRVWRLYEATMVHLASEIISGVNGKNDKEDTKALEAWLDKKPELKQQLEQEKGLIILFNQYVVTKVLGVYADSLPKGNDHRKSIEKWQSSAQVFEELKQVRNQSIIAHGFKGLSKKDLLKSVKLEEEAMLEKLSEFLIVPPGDNPFDIYRACISGLAQA